MAQGQDLGGPGRKPDQRDLVLSDQPVWGTGRILVGQGENEISVILSLVASLCGGAGAGFRWARAKTRSA